MKLKSVVLVAILGLSGCGFKVIKKDEAKAKIADAYSQLDAAKAEACGPEVDGRIDQAKALLDLFVESYLK